MILKLKSTNSLSLITCLLEYTRIFKQTAHKKSELLPRPPPPQLKPWIQMWLKTHVFCRYKWIRDRIVNVTYYNRHIETPNIDTSVTQACIKLWLHYTYWNLIQCF